MKLHGLFIKTSQQTVVFSKVNYQNTRLVS